MRKTTLLLFIFFTGILTLNAQDQGSLSKKEQRKLLREEQKRIEEAGFTREKFQQGLQEKHGETIRKITSMEGLPTNDEVDKARGDMESVYMGLYGQLCQGTGNRGGRSVHNLRREPEADNQRGGGHGVERHHQVPGGGAVDVHRRIR